jgi:hypothetical protein
MTKPESTSAIAPCHCTDSFLDSHRITMHAEFRILDVRRGHVLVQPLDAAKQESLTITNASEYIENEVIVAEPLSSGPGAPSRWQVIASRVDPSFIGGSAPKLATVDQENEPNEYTFTEYVGYEQGEGGLGAVRRGWNEPLHSVPTRDPGWPPLGSRALAMSWPVIQSPPSRTRACGEDEAAFRRSVGRRRGQ